MSTENIELMGHPPYRPSLARSDFFLLPHSKGKRLPNDFRHEKKPLMRSKARFGGVSSGM